MEIGDHLYAMTTPDTSRRLDAGLLLLLLLAALGLRCWDLGARPMHADEANQAAANTEAAVDKMANKMGAAADSAGSKVDDAAITVAVNAELAKDPTLSALRINVDTSGGRVLLKGLAPDSAARERATQLAAAVRGVKTVDNQLEVKS